jgi:hypothetical protein
MLEDIEFKYRLGFDDEIFQALEILKREEISWYIGVS